MDEDVVDLWQLRHRRDDLRLDAVGLSQRQVALDLDVEADVDLRADVVGDDVVGALDVGMGECPLEDLPAKLLGRGAADEVGDVVPDDVDARVEDADRDDDGRQGICDRIAEQGAGDPDQRGDGGEDVVAVVLRRRDEGRRAAFAAGRGRTWRAPRGRARRWRAGRS